MDADPPSTGPSVSSAEAVDKARSDFREGANAALLMGLGAFIGIMATTDDFSHLWFVALVLGPLLLLHTIVLAVRLWKATS